MTANKSSSFLLSLLASVLLLASSLAGILADDGGQPYRFVSVQGEEVQVYGGQGLYRHDNVRKAVEFRGFDWANLAVVLPLFGLAVAWQRRGRVRGRLLLAALFAYLAWIYGLGAIGNAFNALFLVWTALFSLGLFGLALTLAGLDVAALPGKLARFPRRGLAVYMLVVGAFLLSQYLAEIVPAYTAGRPPVSLDHYTTLELAAFELAIMIPLHVTSGVLLWRKRPWGYLLAILLAFAAFVTFVALSIARILAYVSYGQGTVPDLAITLILALVATTFSFLAFRSVPA